MTMPLKRRARGRQVNHTSLFQPDDLVLMPARGRRRGSIPAQVRHVAVVGNQRLVLVQTANGGSAWCRPDELTPITAHEPTPTGSTSKHSLRVTVWRGDPPQVVCLCGSTRFRDEYEQAIREFTLAGAVTLSPGVWVHEDGPTKKQIDVLHRRKIELADRVFVIDPGGYIGESTRSEIEYARRINKPVDRLSEVGWPSDGRRQR